MAGFALFSVALVAHAARAHMNLPAFLANSPVAKWLTPGRLPPHLLAGRLGERAARKHLRKLGLKFLTANFRTERGEIDLVFRERDCLVFVEVKTRSSEDWGRPAAAVDRERRTRLTRAGLDYLRLLKFPAVKVRFDIVEVLLDAEKVTEIRHLPNAFPMEQPFRYQPGRQGRSSGRAVSLG